MVVYGPPEIVARLMLNRVAPTGANQFNVTFPELAVAVRFVGAVGMLLVGFAITSIPLIDALSTTVSRRTVIFPEASDTALNSCTFALNCPPAAVQMSKLLSTFASFR